MVCRSAWKFQPDRGRTATYLVGRTPTSRPPGTAGLPCWWRRACCLMRDERCSPLRCRVLGRPRNLPGVLVGKIGDVAGARGGDSRFDGRVWFLATLDAGKEIRHVVDCSVAEALFTKNGILPDVQALAVDTEA